MPAFEKRRWERLQIVSDHGGGDHGGGPKGQRGRRLNAGHTCGARASALPRTKATTSTG
jgi:hypothetical protein